MGEAGFSGQGDAPSEAAGPPLHPDAAAFPQQRGAAAAPAVGLPLPWVMPLCLLTLGPGCAATLAWKEVEIEIFF